MPLVEDLEELDHPIRCPLGILLIELSVVRVQYLIYFFFDSKLAGALLQSICDLRSQSLAQFQLFNRFRVFFDELQDNLPGTHTK